MEQHDDADGTLTGYDSLADRANDQLEGFESPWGDCPFQEFYSWPVTRSLFPDITDKRVLDAGCGIGDHVEWVLVNGATVVGVDASDRAIEIARDRFGDRATFYTTDLTEPLAFDDDAFDLVFSHLVLGHIEERPPSRSSVGCCPTTGRSSWLLSIRCTTSNTNRPPATTR